MMADSRNWESRKRSTARYRLPPTETRSATQGAGLQQLYRGQRALDGDEINCALDGSFRC